MNDDLYLAIPFGSWTDWLSWNSVRKLSYIQLGLSDPPISDRVEEMYRHGIVIKMNTKKDAILVKLVFG